MIRARGVVALGLVVALWAVLIVTAATAGAAEREIHPRWRHCQPVVFRLPAGAELPPRLLARLCLIQEEWAPGHTGHPHGHPGRGGR